jgi:NADPH2:quinone reductase
VPSAPSSITNNRRCKEIPIIYGGPAAVGAFAFQFAKLSGLSPIITVAGTAIEFVKSLDCATHIIDYRSKSPSDIQAEIKSALGGK